MLTGGMSAKDRRFGCLLIKIGFIMMMMPVLYFGVPIFGPKLGAWFMPKSIRDKAEKAASKPVAQPELPAAPAPEVKSWDPTKEALPPGMTTSRSGILDAGRWDQAKLERFLVTGVSRSQVEAELGKPHYVIGKQSFYTMSDQDDHAPPKRHVMVSFSIVYKEEKLTRLTFNYSDFSDRPFSGGQ